MIGLIRKNLKLDKLKKNNFKGQIDFKPRNLEFNSKAHPRSGSSTIQDYEN